MLARNVTIAAMIAIIAFVGGGLSRIASTLGHAHDHAALWPAWVGLFAMAATLVGAGSGLYAFLEAPRKPAGWHPARRWPPQRIVIAVLLLALISANVALYAGSSAVTAELTRELRLHVSVQFAFALAVWDNLWIWRQRADAIAGSSVDVTGC